jgi:uncharacterized protein YbcV (DUF1398 family)
MKNLKKVLSLVLALAMAFSLMSVAFAVDKASDFTDYDDVDYQEAVDVMVALGVIEGGGDNTFNATGTLTREQGAKIVTYMLLGKDAADKLSSTITSYTDVPANKWSAGVIAYCTERGILAGDGNGKFNPEGALTGQAFAKMLLTALGYDADIQGYTGSAWAINVTADAVSAGIDISGVALTETLTREQATQMAFQTLEATMVEYATKGTNITLSDGTSVNIGASSASAVASETADNVIPDNGGVGQDYTVGNTGDSKEKTVQFVEKYFSNLKKSADTSNGLGVPGNNWTLKGKTVSFSADTPVVVFTGKKTAAEVASELTGYSIYDDGTPASTHNISNAGATTYSASLSAYTTGGDTRFDIVAATDKTPASQIAAGTANGLRVEFYANSRNVITSINVVKYYVGEVTNVVTASDRTTYTIKAINDGSSFSRIDFVSESEDDTIVLNGDIQKGDIVTYTTGKVTNANAVAATPNTIAGSATVYVYPTTKVVGSQSAQNAGSNTITVAGQSYPVGVGIYTKADDTTSGVVTTGFSVSANEATYYLDKDGYVVYSTSSASDDYAFIVAASEDKANGLDGKTPSITVRAALADGTVVVRNVALEKVASSKVGQTIGGHTFVAGDYVLKGTDIFVADNSTAAPDATLTAFAASLVGNVYGYSALDANNITLTTLSAASAANAVSTSYTATLSTLKQNQNLYVSSGTNVLIDTTTTFVVFNRDKNTAAVYTGSANLPKSIETPATAGDDTGYAVLKTGTSNAQYGSASVVFVSTSSGLTANSSSYAYVVANDVTTSLASDGSTVYNYSGYKAGDAAGSPSLTLTSSTKLTAGVNGLYEYSDTNELNSTPVSTSSDTGFGPAGSPSATDLYIYGQLTVVGSQLIVTDTTAGDSKSFAITTDTQTSYFNGLTTIDGHYGFVAVAADGGNRGSTVAGIFVTSAT